MTPKSARLGFAVLVLFVFRTANAADSDTAAGLNDFQKALDWVEKGQTYQAWTAKHAASCETYQSGIAVAMEYEKYCYACSRVTPDTTTRYDFFYDAQKDACTLQQVEVTWWKMTHSNTLPLIEKTASKLLGEGELLKNQDRVWESGSASWKHTFRWQTPMDVAYAYQATHSDKGWLNFLWRWQPLKERAHFSSEESRASREKRHEQTAREMAVACEEAGLSDCLAKARGSDKGYGVKPDVADAYFAESWEKLKTTKSSDPRYAALVYWVKHLWPDCITKEDRIERLTRLGFSIGEPDRETCRSITAPLSPDLSVGWFDSHWGRLEFLKRLKAGWVRGASCAAGDEQIPSVIDQADEYLKKYPKSDISEAVRLERAAAYESWWSAQLFKKQELSSKDPRLSKARESAIQHYEEYLKTHPDNTDVKRSLYYLRNNIDSENRPHYCDPESYC